MTDELLTTVIPDALSGQRLDAALAALFPDYSRSRLSQWVKQGLVEVDGSVPRPRDKVYAEQTVLLRVQALDCESEVLPEKIALDVVYEDDDILVINKPVEMVVHPAAGNWSGTLQNALLYYAEVLSTVPRAGIVHRLDKNTSGLLVVAKNLKAHKSLTEQLQARTVHREYFAVVNGVMTAGGTVDQPIARDARERKRMAVREEGKEAITHYRVIEKFRRHTYIRVFLETGRTHQIRVHMSYIRFPLVGDTLYGSRAVVPKGASETLIETLRGFKRQALHAAKLGLIHPQTGQQMEWQVPVPADMQAVIDELTADQQAHAEAGR
ncbi:MAG: 23S rRNA pseudouridine(1911/1915/1917) synthase RluD [Gammaproteobacteria bacterium]|nr:23S rRNA pseudouridine(1911/1915/1917) synthase RluD [Gammaproteobacteria bacterium]